VSGPRGFAVRVFAVRLARCEPLTDLTIRPAVILRAGAVASTTFRPAFVTIAIRPLPGRNGALKPLIWGGWEGEYFCNCGWTTQIRLIWLGKLVFSRTSAACRPGIFSRTLLTKRRLRLVRAAVRRSRLGERSLGLEEAIGSEGLAFRLARLGWHP